MRAPIYVVPAGSPITLPNKTSRIWSAYNLVNYLPPGVHCVFVLLRTVDDGVCLLRRLAFRFEVAGDAWPHSTLYGFQIGMLDADCVVLVVSKAQ